MPTQKQLIANRANAQRSTGPRTEAGKAASRGNALKHGLTAAQVVIHGEDPTAYDAFRAQLIEEIAPIGSLEATLAHDLVATLWRLRRVPFLENAMLAQADTQHQHAQASDDVLDDLLSDPCLEKKTWAGCPEEDDTLQRIGSAVVDALNALNKLSTYETRLFRRVEGLLTQLLRVRADGAADAATAPRRGAATEPFVINGEALEASWATSQ